MKKEINQVSESGFYELGNHESIKEILKLYPIHSAQIQTIKHEKEVRIEEMYQKVMSIKQISSIDSLKKMG